MNKCINQTNQNIHLQINFFSMCRKMPAIYSSHNSWSDLKCNKLQKKTSKSNSKPDIFSDVINSRCASFYHLYTTDNQQTVRFINVK